MKDVDFYITIFYKNTINDPTSTPTGPRLKPRSQRIAAQLSDRARASTGQICRVSTDDIMAGGALFPFPGSQ